MADYSLRLSWIGYDNRRWLDSFLFEANEQQPVTVHEALIYMWDQHPDFFPHPSNCRVILKHRLKEPELVDTTTAARIYSAEAGYLLRLDAVNPTAGAQPMRPVLVTIMCAAVLAAVMTPFMPVRQRAPSSSLA